MPSNFTRNDTNLWDTKDGIPRNNDHLLRFCKEHNMRDNCHEAAAHEEKYNGN